MLIASIGSDQFALASLDDATQLLAILNRAKVIDDAYVGDFRRVLYEKKAHFGIKVEVATQELLTQEQVDELRAQDAAAKAAKRAAEKVSEAPL